MPKLLCIGHITLDTILFVEDVDIHCDMNEKACTISFPYGAKIPVSKVYDSVGGGASNVVIGTKVLDIDSEILSIIGSDRQANEVIDLLKTFKISDAILGRDSLPTDQSTIISYGTERTIFTYNSDRNFKIDKNLFREYPFVYLSSVGKNVESLYDDIVAFKQSNKQSILFYNPGSKELKYAHHSIQKILPFVDYLIVNVEEACTILNPGLHRNEVTMEDLVSLLEQKGVKNLVLTDGERGVYYNSHYEVKFTKSLKITVVEKTGAGDAFASGFISSILYGKSIDEAVSWGIVNSASAIQKPGAQNGLLDLNGIDAALKALPS